MPTYAPRTKRNRVKVTVQMTPEVKRYIDSLARRTGRSSSSVAHDLLEEAIFGPKSENKAS